MTSPTRGNDCGLAGDSIRVAVAGHTAFIAAWRQHGAVTVDATASVETVGHEVLMAAASALLSSDPGRD